MGHSLGGAVASVFASLFPEKISNLVMIDSFGVFTQPANMAVSILRRSLEYSMKIASKESKGPKLYTSLGDAIQARLNSVKTYPGQQSLSFEAARDLVSR